MTDAMHISASLEDYIEAIFHIVQEKQAAKPRDLAERMKVAGSSVTGALKMLADKALINYTPYDIITLTPAGKAYAEDVVRRHEVLRDFFVNVLAVDYKAADEAACGMEHSVSKVILERLVRFAEFVEVSPCGGKDWISGFRQHCEKAPALKMSELKPGDKGVIVAVNSQGEIAQRLVDMGMVKGTPFKVLRKAPLGDPLEIQIRGFLLALRKQEAECVSVEKKAGK